MRILALVPGGISDQILFFPTLEDLKIHYPNAQIDVLVEPRAKAAYRLYPHVHEVLLFDYKDRNGLADYLNLLGIIRDREYEIAISSGQRWTERLLLWLNGIPVRIGYESTTSWLLSQPVPLKTEQYVAYMYHDLVRGLGIHSPCPQLKVQLPTADIDWAEAEQRRFDLQASGYILVHGSSIQPASLQPQEQIYPVPKWQRIIKDIQQKQPNLKVVLLPNPGDAEWVSQMQAACPDIQVINAPDIGKLAAIIAAANLMLCVDSTLMHLSVAVGTYTIALFGSNQASKLLPPSQDRYLGIQSPTGKIGDIKPEAVLQQIWR